MNGKTPETDLIAHLQALCTRLRDTERVTVRPDRLSMRNIARDQGYMCLVELYSFRPQTSRLSKEAGLPELYSFLPTAEPNKGCPMPFPEDLPSIACYRPRTKDWATFQPLVAEHLRNEFVRIAENEWIPWLESTADEETPIPEVADESTFSTGSDYACVTWKGANFSLTPKQRAVVECLHFNYQQGIPEVAWETLKERANMGSSVKCKDFLRGMKDAKVMIKKGTRRDTLRLDM